MEVKYVILFAIFLVAQYFTVKEACLSALKKYYKDLIKELKDERL